MMTINNYQHPNSKTKRRKIFHRGQDRSGTIAIAVLICVFVVSTITISCMSISTRYRRQMQNELRLEQTRWILDGGVRSALRKLDQDPEYEGQTLKVKTELPVFDQGIIQIKTTSNENDQIELRVVAELTGDQDIKKFQRSTTLIVSKQN